MPYEKPITFENLRVHHHTGSAKLIRDDGPRRKVYGYRVGVMTNLGDLEQDVWSQMARQLIHDSGEEQLQTDLLEWTVHEVHWLHRQAEQEQYALELHMDRIFDDPAWVGYIPFNRKYRPEVLDHVKLVWIQTECCKKPQQVTPELLRRAGESANATIYCAICGRWSGFKRCLPGEADAGA